ncbi:MAG: hypothetical protein EAY75_13025 [Bacteroidetes bacterium]|nr:MAG: hypothetical protein EAY75_13025 [Bacteroidota bacterium]
MRSAFIFDGQYLMQHTTSKLLSIVVPLWLCFWQLSAVGQQRWELTGTVYDKSQRNIIDGVTVQTTSGRGTATDSLGRYRIIVSNTDSVYFSYQNRVTGKYPVTSFEDPTQFNMSIHINVFALPNVTVRARNYRMDSLSNRQDYAKYFNYSKPNPLTSINVGPTGVGMDPNAIINMFRFKRNRQLQSLQKHLLEDEQSRYIDFRFNKNFVKELTNLSGDQLKMFMRKYRPPYDFVVLTNNLELGYYIQQCYRKDKGQLPQGLLIYSLGIDTINFGR